MQGSVQLNVLRLEILIMPELLPLTHWKHKFQRQWVEVGGRKLLKLSDYANARSIVLYKDSVTQKRNQNKWIDIESYQFFQIQGTLIYFPSL